MKEFASAVEDVLAQDEREARIVALMEKDGLTRVEAENAEDEDQPIEFKLDGRLLKAYQPTDGQLMFMLANLGRGQSADQRFAAIINVMLSALRDEDRDYLEARLLSRGKDRLRVSQIEEIFEYLTGEWFARPTQQQ